MLLLSFLSAESMNSTGSKMIPKRQLSRETEQRVRSSLQRPQTAVAGRKTKPTPATISSATPKRTPTFSGHERTSDMEANLPVSRPARKVLSVSEVPPPPLPALTPANVTGNAPWQAATPVSSALPPRPPMHPFTNNKLASSATEEANDPTKVRARSRIQHPLLCSSTTTTNTY